jgi:hypothetical protein
MLKKAFSIVLLGILLFNWFGYRLLISFVEYKVDAQLEAHLDENNYDELQLVSIKAPTTYLSYYNNSKLFERVDGQLEINGVQYKYVKRRLFNDSVELLCIPNQAAMKLRVAKNDYFKLVNDLQHKENKKNSSDFSKNISTDYQPVNTAFLLNDLHFTSSKWAHYVQNSRPLYCASIIENPPEGNYFSLSYS